MRYRDAEIFYPMEVSILTFDIKNRGECETIWGKRRAKYIKLPISI